MIDIFTVFILAIFVGNEIINKVPPTLHTPLMSGSNAISGIAIVGASCLVMAQTLKGRVFLNFVKEARHELRKVVWPSRQEATKNTILVAIIVVLMSCLLWGVDSLFSWLIAWFVG